MVELSVSGKIAFFLYSSAFFAMMLMFIGTFFHVKVFKQWYREHFCKSDLYQMAIIFFSIFEVLVIIGLIIDVQFLVLVGLVWQSVIFLAFSVYILSCGISVLAKWLYKVHKEIGKRKGV